MGPPVGIESKSPIALRSASRHVLTASRLPFPILLLALMTWISRLALIAYLLGGWLLPAAHYHADHDHGTCGHVADASTDADAPHRCCVHAHDDDDGAEESSHQDSRRPHFSATESLLTCDGLCALCSARSLASPTWKQKSTSMAQRDPSDRVLFVEPAFGPASPSREHFGRGPPAIA